MAKPTRSIPVCYGLTLEGADLVFAGCRSPILECAKAAFDRTDPGSDIERELGHALGLRVSGGKWVNNSSLAVPGGLGAAGWAAVLACDPELPDALRADDARAAGLAVIASMIRTAGPCPDPLAVVLAVAEAARLNALGGRTMPHHARQLSVPHAVEVACWRPVVYDDGPGGGLPDFDLVVLTARLARLQVTRERDFRGTRVRPHPIILTGEILPAVRLTGGLVGSAVLRPAGDSALAWATATWRLCRAALAGPRAAAKPKAKPAKPAKDDEQPVVVLVDGVVLAHGDLPAEAAAAVAREAEAGSSATLTAIGGVARACADAETFIADRTRRRDEAARLPGEQRYLQDIIEGRGSALDSVNVALTQQVRQTAADLLAGPPGASRFVALREAVREIHLPRLASMADRVGVWARALATLVAREVADAADVEEGAILDALERETPGALGALLRCGEIADPWGALVALTAADAEAAAVRENLTRPAMVKRLLALQERATRSLGSAARPHLRHEVETLVAVLRDERAECVAFLVPTFAEARLALLNSGGTAVAVRQGHRPESWRVLSGSLLTLVRAGLGELQEREGVVTAEWCPPGLPIGDLTDALLAWAVQEWQAAGCDGAPPSMLDALIHNEAANVRRAPARQNKRR